MSSILLVCGLIVATFAANTGIVAEPERKSDSIQLWEKAAPGAKGESADDIPSVVVYQPASEKRTGAAVVICPGGGYGGLADHEGKPIAEWLNSLGVTGIVLKYRLGPKYHHPVMLQDVSRAIRWTRFHSKDYELDTNRIGVLGFSAGGHLASTVTTHFDAGDPSAEDPIDRLSSRPDASILIYPVISMKKFTHGGSRNNLLGETPDPKLIDLLSNETQVTKKTPPCFLVHTEDDGAVPVENSQMFVAACRKAGVPVEYHQFVHGPHGFGLAQGDPVLGVWPQLCASWLKGLHFTEKVTK